MTEKTCLVLLIVSDSRIADVHRSTLRSVGFDVRRLPAWSGDLIDFDPEVVIVQLPEARRAADVATRLRAQARFEPLILLGLSSRADFEAERRAGRDSGFDDVLPLDVAPGALLSRVQELLAARPPLTPCVTITPPAA